MRLNRLPQRRIVPEYDVNRFYGAITMPAVKEAMLLHEIDVIDASMYQYEQVEKTLNPGEMSDRIFGLGVKVYKPAANAEEKANV